MNKINLKKSFIAVIFFGVVSFAHAHSVYVAKCPPAINVTQKLVDSFSDWHLFNPPTQHYLSHVEMYSGNPAELASLKPDFSNSDKTIWSFQQDSKNYIVCEYNDTSIKLTQLLPPGITTCTIWYKKYQRNKSGNGVPDRVVCQ